MYLILIIFRTRPPSSLECLTDTLLPRIYINAISEIQFPLLLKCRRICISFTSEMAHIIADTNGKLSPYTIKLKIEHERNWMSEYAPYFGPPARKANVDCFQTEILLSDLLSLRMPRCIIKLLLYCFPNLNLKIFSAVEYELSSSEGNSYVQASTTCNALTLKWSS